MFSMFVWSKAPVSFRGFLPCQDNIFDLAAEQKPKPDLGFETEGIKGKEKYKYVSLM